MIENALTPIIEESSNGFTRYTERGVASTAWRATETANTSTKAILGRSYASSAVLAALPSGGPLYNLRRSTSAIHRACSAVYSTLAGGMADDERPRFAELREMMRASTEALLLQDHPAKWTAFQKESRDTSRTRLLHGRDRQSGGGLATPDLRS